MRYFKLIKANTTIDYPLIYSFIECSRFSIVIAIFY